MRAVALVACLLVFPLIVMMFARFHDETFDLISESDKTNVFRENCEPFQDKSWLLPRNFPREFGRFNNSVISNVFKKFCCDESRTIFQNVPWLILKSDEYFIPALFLIPSFREELERMFPDKESVFHHLGRYLFHPSNKVWGIITRFHDSYLADAVERIGIQIRVFDHTASPFQKLTDQILYCALQENLLPEIDMQKLVALPSKNRTRKAVLIASLHSEFYENIAKRFWKFPTLTGEVIEVYQPSREEYRHFGDKVHNMKAWVEMYLLSLCDELVTSSGSSFGYVAQGLGDLRLWILHRPEKWRDSGDESCRLGVSIEGCFDISPGYYDCKEGNSDMGKIVPYVKHCEDSPSGLKLVNDFGF